MPNTVSMINKIAAHGLEDKIEFVGKTADEHLKKSTCIMQTTGATLPSEMLAITMTPYTISKEVVPEYYYQFEVMSLDSDAVYFDHSSYYAESAIDWKKDVTNRQVFTVYGRKNAQEIFGFLCSQFFY